MLHAQCDTIGGDGPLKWVLQSTNKESVSYSVADISQRQVLSVLQNFPFP